MVLVGGGHAHVQVLRRWAMKPPADVRLTVVVDRPVAVYSGMVPALVAGEVARHELEIDVRPLARRAGAAVVVDPMVRVDAGARTIHTASGRPPLRYDVASLDIGSTVAATDLPGVAEHAVPTRPIVRLLDRLDAALARLQGQGTPRVVVVGAGAGGVELAACLQGRLARQQRAVDVTLVSSGDHLLPGAPDAFVRTTARALGRRGITVVGPASAVEVTADAVALADGRRLPADLVLWVTGAVGHAVLGQSGLPVDPRGFVHVRDTLQVVGHDTLFAVGDCALLVDHPWVPRAGVYAVRQGPVLGDNLDAWLQGASLRSYTPQSDFLSMLNLGDGTAVVGKWRRAARGRWVWRWKDRIDRAFMERFQVLGPAGRSDTPFGRAMPAMDGDGMVCGGCAAKVDARTLHALLPDVDVEPDGVVVGLAARDDAARVAVGGGDVALTVDGFPPFCDDLWLVGRAAVANAVNDVHAKGATPRYALATLHGAAGDALDALMAGVRRGLSEAGVALVGGHTASADAPFVGLTVVGDAGGRWWGLHGSTAGDILVLTGPVGTGILWRADALGRAAGPWMDAVAAAMVRGQGAAAAVLAAAPVHAATDVSGFGLAGHLVELATASDVACTLHPEGVPRFEGVDVLLRSGLRSTAHPANAAVAGVQRGPHLDPVAIDVVYDPQTAGPLLVALPAGAVADVLAALAAAGHDGAVVGTVQAPRADGVRVHLLGGRP